MLLEVEPNRIERGDKAFDPGTVGEFTSGTFGIADPVMAMKVFRGSIYKNKPRIISQELMSNGRDAHRELAEDTGNPACATRPLDVFLPTVTDATFAVRDYGVGISPERIRSVVLDYFSSTKRRSNSQTGAFGLGAKTPFSYVDLFSLITFIPDSTGAIFRREYVAYIDESGAGAIDLVNPAEPSNEERGTRVSFSVPLLDQRKFRKEALNVVRFWSEKPNFYGVDAGEAPATAPAILLSGEGWFISSCPEDKGKGPCVILDGVAYPFAISDLRNPPEELAKANELPLFLTFNTGSGVMPLATREFLDFSVATSEALVTVLTRVKHELARLVRHRLDACSTVLEASLVFHKQWKKLWWSEAKPTYRRLPLLDINRPFSGVNMITYEVASKHPLKLNRSAHSNPTLLRIADMGRGEYAIDFRIAIHDTNSERPSLSRIKGLFQSTNFDKQTCVVMAYEGNRGDPDVLLKTFNDLFGSETEVLRLSECPTFKQPRKPRPEVNRTYGAFKVGTEFSKGKALLAKTMPAGGVYMPYRNSSPVLRRGGGELCPTMRRRLGYVLDGQKVAVVGIPLGQLKPVRESPRWCSVEEWAAKRLARLLGAGDDGSVVELCLDGEEHTEGWWQGVATLAPGSRFANALAPVSSEEAFRRYRDVSILSQFLDKPFSWKKTKISLGDLISEHYPLLSILVAGCASEEDCVSYIKMVDLCRSVKGAVVKFQAKV